MAKEYRKKTVTKTKNTHRNAAAGHSIRTGKRYFRLTSLFLASVALAAVMRLTTVDANADVPERYKYYTNVYVDRDTTLWNITNEYISDEYASARAYMEEVKSINHLPDDQLIYGTTICVPYYSDEYKK